MRPRINHFYRFECIALQPVAKIAIYFDLAKDFVRLLLTF